MSEKNQPMPRETWLNRVRYRSWHRGCKETDLIIGGFCNAHIHELDDAELTLFEQFLDEDDADIWGWITGKIVIANDAYQPIIERLRAFEVYKYPQ